MGGGGTKLGGGCDGLNRARVLLSPVQFLLSALSARAALFLSLTSPREETIPLFLLSSIKRMPSGSEEMLLLSTIASISRLGALSVGRPAEQFESRLSGLFNSREGVCERE